MPQKEILSSLSSLDRQASAAKHAHVNTDGIQDVVRQLHLADKAVKVQSFSESTWQNVGDFFTKLAASPVVDRLKADFGWIVTICLSLYNMYHAAFIRKEKDDLGILGRSMQFGMGAVGIALGVTAIVAISGVITIAMPILFVASYAKSTFEYLLEMSHDIFYRHRKKPEIEKEINDLKEKLMERSEQDIRADSDEIKALTKALNKKNNLNIQIAEKAHLVVISAVSLIGAALLFTPAAPVGIAIMLGVTAYSLLDAAGLNPFRYLARKINSKLKTPLATRTEADVAAEIKQELKKEQDSQWQKDTGLQPMAPVIELKVKHIQPEIKIKETMKQKFRRVGDKLKGLKASFKNAVIKHNNNQKMPVTHVANLASPSRKSLMLFTMFRTGVQKATQNVRKVSQKATQAIKKKVGGLRKRKVKKETIEMSQPKK